MDRSSVIYLIDEEFEVDEMGVQTPEESMRKVYANVTSVSGSEWFEGGRNGLNPDLKFRIFKYDYAGEEIIEYNSNRYAVYRTYEARNDILELYVERKKGDQ